MNSESSSSWYLCCKLLKRLVSWRRVIKSWVDEGSRWRGQYLAQISSWRPPWIIAVAEWQICRGQQGEASSQMLVLTKICRIPFQGKTHLSKDWEDRSKPVCLKSLRLFISQRDFGMVRPSVFPSSILPSLHSSIHCNHTGFHLNLSTGATLI